VFAVSIRCPGFRFAGVSAGIKKKTGALDLGLIVADRPATGAAIFTSNRVKAAPVVLSQAALKRSGGRVDAVVVNSGNANACTGRAGMADARRMATATGRVLGVATSRVLVASTGVIGQRLPIDRIERGIEQAASEVEPAIDPFADAILTTDLAAKIARGRAELGGRRVTLAGCTKGAGMIAPNMATTLTFVVTDARLGPSALHRALTAAAAETFNAITVDGDTSTNDMLLLLASGHADNAAPSRDDQIRFRDALTRLLDQLARALMRGGEGVHHVVKISVSGARSAEAARRVARTIATSPLVKTAIAGSDPNWGRILCAAGNAGVPIDPQRLALWFDRVQMVAGGAQVSAPTAEQRARTVMQRPEYTVTLDLGQGRAVGHYLACDLSHEYISINADYRS
jgi:glutamate N-acetyltransferase / amino-acid N-acetyltransferase